jgi:hypothetical protein
LIASTQRGSSSSHVFEDESSSSARVFKGSIEPLTPAPPSTNGAPNIRRLFSYLSRVSRPVLAAKVATADEAVAHIHHGDNVGFSRFTGAGYPKAVPAALAKAMIEAHDDGRKFQVDRRRSLIRSFVCAR